MASPSSSMDYPPAKRRRTSPSPHGSIYNPMPNGNGANGAQVVVAIPKRGARACTACRKGKNRCEGEAPCRRCQIAGIQCVFEKPEKKNPVAVNGSLDRLEGQYLVMQSQMIGLQSSLDRILTTLQNPPPPPLYPAASGGTPFPTSAARGSDISPYGTEPNGPPSAREQRKFPPLPGFAPPPHKYATYGIVPSTAPSSDDESEDTLPRATINAPIEALQGLANAAAEAAAVPTTSPSLARVKKRRRVEPIPPNSFPHVVEKGLVTDAEARELYHIFFSGCHFFIPLFDPAYDTYDSLKERTPFCFDAILAVASKIRAGTGAPSATFYKCLEEAQGIARSTLFGPVVRKEAVQATLLLAAWSTSGWLPSGHAMRMALDLGLNRALEKLADSGGKRRSEAEERDLVVSARIWLCLYWFDHQMSLGTGRPIVLRDESSVRHCRLLLSHHMSSPSDLRLVSLIELIGQKTQIYETLTPVNDQVTHTTLSFIRRANLALEKWWSDCDELHRPTMDEDSLLRKILVGELYYAKLWLVCVALRGVSWDKMPFEQRELAFQAKEAATNCLATFLQSPAYRAALRYAVHDCLVTAAFSGLFLLKVANLFPTEVELPSLIQQVEQLAQLLSEVAAERYALTLRLMLANLRRKLGLGTVAHTPLPQPLDGSTILVGGVPGPTPGSNQYDPLMPPPGIATAPPPGPPHHHPQVTVVTGMEEFGFHWPAENGWSPSSIPAWLQEASLTDLGLPINGSDGIFLNAPGHWQIDLAGGPMPEAW